MGKKKKPWINYDLPTKTFPILIWYDKKRDDIAYEEIPDLNIKCAGYGIFDAHHKLHKVFHYAMKDEKLKNIIPSEPDELKKLHPDKTVNFVNYYEDETFEDYFSSPSELVLKIEICESEKIFKNAEEVIELNSKFDKLRMFMCLLKHSQASFTYDLFYNPKLDYFKDNEGEKQRVKIIETREELEALIPYLIEEYARLKEQDIERVKDNLEKVKSKIGGMSCCAMMRMTETCTNKFCCCGFQDYESIKKQLEKLGCFKDPKAFATRFLSKELKVVGIKTKREIF